MSTREFELDFAMDKLKVENSLLLDRVDVLEVYEETSKVDLLVESPFSKLNKIFGFQKPYGDKCGLGFDQKASTSKSPLVNKGKMILFPLPKFEQCS